MTPGCSTLAWHDATLPDAAVQRHDHADAPDSSVHWRDVDPQTSS